MICYIYSSTFKQIKSGVISLSHITCIFTTAHGISVLIDELTNILKMIVINQEIDLFHINCHIMSVIYLGKIEKRKSR